MQLKVILPPGTVLCARDFWYFKILLSSLPVILTLHWWFLLHLQEAILPPTSWGPFAVDGIRYHFSWACTELQLLTMVVTELILSVCSFDFLCVLRHCIGYNMGIRWSPNLRNVSFVATTCLGACQTWTIKQSGNWPFLK